MADFREYVGADFYGEFLLHYGVGHLQGGRSGRYPWGSTNNSSLSRSDASRYTRALNREEKNRAKSVSKLRKSIRKKITYNIEDHQEDVKRAEDKINEMVQMLTEKGYDITSKDVERDVAFGKYLMTSLFLTATFAPVVVSVFNKENEQFIEGKKWKVRVPKS